MTGREAPSSRSLEQNLVKRVQVVEGTEGLERRFNRMGLPRRDPVLEKRFNRMGVSPEANTNSASLISLKQGKKVAPAPPAVSKANTPTADNSLGLDIE